MTGGSIRLWFTSGANLLVLVLVLPLLCLFRASPWLLSEEERIVGIALGLGGAGLGLPVVS